MYVFVLCAVSLASLTCSIVAALFLYRLVKNPQTMTSRVAWLRKDQYLRTYSSRFPNYYEPKSDTIINDAPSWLGHEVSYSINHDTLNERHEYAVPKPPRTYRIVTLGDSFTFGLFVNTYENYSELLEDRLHNDICRAFDAFEVINLGVPAYDIGYSAERFRLRGQKYQPDLVILFLNPFSIEIDADRKSALEHAYLAAIPEGKRIRFIDGMERYYPGVLSWFAHLRERPEYERVSKQAAYLSEFLGMYRGPLIIAANNWNRWTPYTQFALRSVMFGQSHAQLFTGLPTLTGEHGLFPDSHPNAQGHREIADALYALLHERGGVLQDAGCVVP